MMSPFSFPCSECSKVKTYELDTDKVLEWKAGALIQNVFPDIQDLEIMISGICSDCFDKLFEDGELGDDELGDDEATA